MGLWSTLKSATSTVARTTRRQTQRARLEMRSSRLHARIRREQTKIGEALYPHLAAGDLETEVAEVQVAVRAIASLQDELAETERGIAELKAAGASAPEPRPEELP